MKQAITILSLIALAAAALFWQQVWSIFAGMTVLESLEMIVQFILHVAVGTIVVYGVATAPELIKPWMRAFRRKQRQSRRARVIHVQSTAPKPKRLTATELLSVLAPDKKIQRAPTLPRADDHPDLNF
jgi:hypothetical protein